MTKLEKAILASMFGLQFILLLTVNAVIATFVPPILTAIPAGFLTLRSDQAVRMSRRSYSPFVRIAVATAAVTAFFVLAPDDVSLKFKIVRALFVDATILWFASAVALQAHILRQGTLSSS
jgi:hypothetical protein